VSTVPLTEIFDNVEALEVWAMRLMPNGAGLSTLQIRF
jgi:hypothetical protein